MPYRSAAQRRFLHAVHPRLAAKWDKKYSSSAKAKLPQHVKKSK